MTKVTFCHVQVQVTKRPWLSFWAFSLALSLTHSEGRQLPCYELPHGEAHMARGWGWLWPKASEEVNPANTYISELGSRSSSNRALRRDYSSGWQFDGNLVRPWGRGTQLSHSWIPDTQKLWDNKYVLLF